jgi:hypothetical protein
VPDIDGLLADLEHSQPAWSKRIRAVWRRLPVVGFLAGPSPEFYREHLERLMEGRAQRPPEPVNLEEHFLTALILDSGGLAHVSDYVERGEGKELDEWLRDAERLGFVTRPGRTRPTRNPSNHRSKRTHDRLERPSCSAARMVAG